ncbi:MAG: hypothetical protein AAF533_11625 [Acidobacteriota bacterium]
MTERFRRNGARAWLGRVLFSLICAAVLIGLLLVGALSRGDGVSPRTLLAPTMLSLMLNLAVLSAFVVALILVLRWLVRASREEATIDRFAQGLTPGAQLDLHSVDLAPLKKSALGERIEVLATASRAGRDIEVSALGESLLDREEARVAAARYAAGTLVLLGLLGTFLGLLLTIGGVTAVVDNLDVSPQTDIEAFLIQLKEGLRRPLEGMSLAFGTSLLGLLGSLILGVAALGLSAAQASWTGKLEELTALALAPAQRLSPGAAMAMPAPAPAAPAPVQGAAPGSQVDLARAEAVASLLVNGQQALESRQDRFEGASSRMVSALEDFRERVAALAWQNERMETVLARLADVQSAGREALNDQGVKLADLAGAAAALRSDVRDGRAEIQERLDDVGSRLGEGIAGGLAELSRSTRAVGGQGMADHQALVEALKTLQSSVQEASAQRREEARHLAGLLESAARPGSAPTLPTGPDRS